MKFIFIQAIGILGTLLFFLSYQCKSNKNLFRILDFSHPKTTFHSICNPGMPGITKVYLLRVICTAYLHTFYTVTYDAPQESPAPNPAIINRLPLGSFPLLYNSSKRRGMLAEEVLPYSSKFMGNFSIGSPSRLATDSTILLLAW